MVEELATLAPGGGLAATVVGLFLAHTRATRADRQDYRAALAAARTDYDQRAKELRAEAAEAEARAETEIGELRRRLADADAVASSERARARRAELDLEGTQIRLEHAAARLRIAQGEDP